MQGQDGGRDVKDVRLMSLGCGWWSKWDAQVTFRGTVSAMRGLAELSAGGL